MGYYERVEYGRQPFTRHHEEATVIIKPSCEMVIYTYSGVYIVKATSIKFIPSNSNKITTICKEGD